MIVYVCVRVSSSRLHMIRCLCFGVRIVWGSCVPPCPVYLYVEHAEYWCLICCMYSSENCVLYHVLAMHCSFALSLASVPLSSLPTWVNWVTRPKTLQHSQILCVFCTCATTINYVHICAYFKYVPRKMQRYVSFFISTPLFWGTRSRGRRRSTTSCDCAATVRPSSTGCADGKRCWALKSAHTTTWILESRKVIRFTPPKKDTGGGKKNGIRFPLQSDFAQLWRGFSPAVKLTSLEGGPPLFRPGDGERLCDGESTPTLECSCRMCPGGKSNLTGRKCPFLMGIVHHSS